MGGVFQERVRPMFLEEGGAPYQAFELERWVLDC